MESFPLPQMDNRIDSRGDAKIYFTLDENNGYLQTGVDKSHCERHYLPHTIACNNYEKCH